MSEILYEKTFTPDSRDVDYSGHLRPGALMLVMQEAASTHAESLGAGYDKLTANHLAWVLTRVSVKMQRYPRMFETIRLRTWPAKMRHAIFPRYFEFETLDGEPIGCASTAWAIIDTETRRMAEDLAVFGVTVPENTERKPPMGMPRAPRAVEGETAVSTRRAAYSDVDINGHVNNTRYIDWLCDILPYEQFKKGGMTSFTIGYESEIKYGEEVELLLTVAENSFSVFGSADGRPCFSAAGEFGAE